MAREGADEAQSSLAAARRSSGLTTITRIQRSTEVRTQLERAIDAGNFLPGERLPSERELVELLGVSRVSVRAALRSLEAVGRIEIYQGRGCFVAEQPTFQETAARWLATHRDEVFELIDVRTALDELAARRAAERRDTAGLRRISDTHTEFSAEALKPEPDRPVLVDLDVAFHLAVAEASGNQLLTDLIQDLNSYLGEIRIVAFGRFGRPERSEQQHQRVVDEINAGRPDAAAAAVRAHVDSVREVMQRSVREASDVPSAEA